MFSRHIWHQLAAHLEGQLGSREARKVERHLNQCELCRGERERVRLGRAALNYLPAAQAPDTVWTSIEAALPGLRSRSFPAMRRRRLAFAMTALLALAGASYWTAAHRRGMRWDVVRIQGTPAVGAKAIGGSARVGAGEWIETDSSSRASLKVGEIGSVEVAPNTRLRIVTARSGEQRLALARGEIQAKINAPPRLFFVDIASATAVDLGCVPMEEPRIACPGRRKLPHPGGIRPGRALLR
jgi:FecR protein/Putative zinc-finger